MTVLKSAHGKNKVKYLFFINIATCIILFCKYMYNQDENSLSKTLENGNKVNISLVMRTHRLLAKHVYQNEMPTRGLQNKELYNRVNYKLEKGKGHNNTFDKLKQGRSNNLDIYLKSYKNRYSKKKGLSKLDCYFEKKVLEKIHGLYGVGEKLRNEKKSFKNFILKKYGIGLILFALIPALGLIYPILFGGGKWWKCMFLFCPKENHNRGEGAGTCPNRHSYKWEATLGYIRPAVLVFTWTMIIIILLFVFYTLIKVVKYERLKSGKD
ncbi:Plasmodium exported protein, unknown function [Plasmodium vivax]|uniref:Fam-l protein n=1 Tax=Plasmodium vivax TaxID=5855 RepID=A0A565A5P2_PLAVI|nr:Plasmodium exported protein, unknown function [Plasmodium vivax]